MEAVLSLQCLKTFCKVLSFMNKFGDHIRIEPKRDCVILSTTNQARSVFIVVNLHPDFFEYYSKQGGNDDENDREIYKRLQLKPLLNIFKHNNNLENVSKCKLSFSSNNNENMYDRLIVKYLCKHDIVKVHKLNYEETEKLVAAYTKNTQNKWVASPKIINEWISHFQQSLEEVSIICHREYVSFKSFTEESVSRDEIKRSLVTSLTADSNDFDHFNVHSSTRITIRLKEFKAILLLAESMQCNITAYFDGPGDPVTFCISHAGVFSADFVIATVNEDQVADAAESLVNVSQKSLLVERVNLSKPQQSFGSSSTGASQRPPVADSGPSRTPVRSVGEAGKSPSVIPQSETSSRVVETPSVVAPRSSVSSRVMETPSVPQMSNAPLSSAKSNIHRSEFSTKDVASPLAKNPNKAKQLLSQLLEAQSDRIVLQESSENRQPGVDRISHPYADDNPEAFLFEKPLPVYYRNVDAEKSTAKRYGNKPDDEVVLSSQAPVIAGQDTLVDRLAKVRTSDKEDKGSSNTGSQEIGATPQTKKPRILF